MIQRFLFPFSRKKPPEGPRYGDMYERSIAAMIDLSLIFVLLNRALFEPLTQRIYSHGDLALVRTIPANATFGQAMQTAWDAHMVQLWLVNACVQVLIIGFFMVGFQIVYHTTPGKWLFGLKIMRHESDEPVGALRYVVRFFGVCIACVPLMLGMVWGMFNKKRRGWHDYIAGTVVINTRPHGWYWQKTKQGFRWVRNQLFPTRAVENAVAEPTAQQSHEDSDKPV